MKCVFTTLMPDQTTQTEADPLYQEAYRIVNNFEIIEKYWQRVERTNHLLLGCSLSLGIIVVLIKFHHYG